MDVLEMTEEPRKRGRPKGTGLDDSALLSAIARLRAVDSDLKPTTAIRKLGITDPSVVRRLRDKLKATPAQSEIAVRRENPAGVPVKLVQRPQLDSTPQVVAPVRRQHAGPLLTGVTANLDVGQKESTSSSRRASTRQRKARQASPKRQVETQSINTRTSSSEGSASSNRPEPEPRVANEEKVGTAQSGPPTARDTYLTAFEPQVEAMRLAAEAAAAMSRLYLHCLTYANQISPLAIALRSQSMTTQWFAAAMAGHLGAMRARDKKSD